MSTESCAMAQLDADKQKTRDPDMSDAAVTYTCADGVGVIELNRPDNRNSMTPELLAAFKVAALEAAADVEARCVVIRGKGSCFSAGADFKSNIQLEAERPRQPFESSFAMYDPFLTVLDIKVPVIAALNGHAVGGGFGLALVCDIRIGNKDSKYGANFTKLGLHPGMAVTYLLPRLVGLARASELLYTGALVRGHEAADIGLLNRALPAEEVVPAAMEMAQTIAANAPVAMLMTKKSIRDGLRWAIKEAAYQEAFAQATTVAMEDSKEGMAALLERRAPSFKGR